MDERFEIVDDREDIGRLRRGVGEVSRFGVEGSHSSDMILRGSLYSEQATVNQWFAVDGEAT